MRLADLPTPCLVLDRALLRRNLAVLAAAVGRHGVPLRPHLAAAKSIDVARLALGTTDGGAPPGIAVSTLAEAEYFLSHDVTGILYAVGVTPGKLAQVAKLNAAGGQVMVVTDDPGCASAIAAYPAAPQVLIEVDCGGNRGGVDADAPLLLDIAARLGTRLAGVMTHGGQSYNGRSAAEMAEAAEIERSAAVHAAARLTTAGYRVSVVSVGSSPTVLHAASLDGVTEVRAGACLFGDLFQAQIGVGAEAGIALSVLASVIGARPPQLRWPGGALLLDAGTVALSMDRSTAATASDSGFGLMADLDGRASFGRAIVRAAWQEQALVELDPAATAPQPVGVGSKVRVLPNNAGLAAAAHDRYFVVEGGDEVVAIWPKVSGW